MAGALPMRARRMARAVAVVALLAAVMALPAACASEEPVAGEDAETSDSGAEMPEAPDFTLDLADDSEFVLSEEKRATFLVFWAEW